jgi:hypothetical protein
MAITMKNSKELKGSMFKIVDKQIEWPSVLYYWHACFVGHTINI